MRTLLVTVVLGTLAAGAIAQQQSGSASAGNSSKTLLVNTIPNVAKGKAQMEFSISSAGGAIVFAPAKADDLPTRDSLRAFGVSASEHLGRGDSSLLPGLFSDHLKEWNTMKKTDGVSVAVEQTLTGFRIALGATSQQSRSAIHEFVRAARGNLAMSPEERAMSHPGNNLGWDAQPDPNLSK